MCQNIDDFNRGCALILGFLYRNFPRPVILSVDKLDSGSDLLPEVMPERMKERMTVYSATVEFLFDEGYLVYINKAGPENSRSFSSVRLTPKGLAALNRVPESLRPPEKTIGDSLVDFGRCVLNDGAHDMLKQMVGAIFC
ncbi:putative DUF2513 domain-containing protein [Gammaproteobacteria bacterium]